VVNCAAVMVTRIDTGRPAVEGRSERSSRFAHSSRGVSDGLCKRFGLVLKGRCLNVYTGRCERRIAAVGS
jgi:hypothetical protein